MPWPAWSRVLSDIQVCPFLPDGPCRDRHQGLFKGQPFKKGSSDQDGPGRIRTGDLRRVSRVFSQKGPNTQSVDLGSTSSHHNRQDYRPEDLSGITVDLSLPYSKAELAGYTELRKQDVRFKSCDWLDRAASTLWEVTKGNISQSSTSRYRAHILKKYKSKDSYSKSLGFARAFLQHLASIRSDGRYGLFAVFLRNPKIRRTIKAVTSRIVTIEDIRYVLAQIRADEASGVIGEDRAKQVFAYVLFGAYTGQRPLATISTITVGQIRKALASDKPCIHVLPEQDKIRMEHWVPVHPDLIPYLKDLCKGRKADERVFKFNSVQIWLKRHPIKLSRCDGRFAPSDLRKFSEQYGDVIQWDQSNRAYILTHGVSGVQWGHYKHPLPEYVYDVYMKYWEPVSLEDGY